MERVRRNGMIDINAAIEQGLIQYNEAEVHGARKNKFWFNNYTWMYKERSFFLFAPICGCIILLHYRQKAVEKVGRQKKRIVFPDFLFSSPEKSL